MTGLICTQFDYRGSEISMLDEKSCEDMNKPSSERCGECVWWYEGPILCQGCPNNPETETKKIGGN